MTSNNSNAFCADYSNIASCLFSIQAMEDSGALANYPEIIRLLNALEGDALLKLYSKTLIVLARLEGVEITSEYLAGDFWRVDFSETDFWVGYADTANTSYSSTFQTVLNIFKVFCSRSSELTTAEIQSLNTVFIAFLDAYNALRMALTQAGLNPCGAPITTNYNNSTSLYMQAAGSDGSNGIAEGIHLRWSLAGDLGANHLPQGDYFSVADGLVGYNQPNDFVQITRTPYTNQATGILDLSTEIPAIDYASLRWTYTLNQVLAGQSITNIVRLTFKDSDLYTQAALAIAPQTDPFGFLKSYNGQIDVSIDNKNLYLFAYNLGLADGQSSATLRVEAFGTSYAEATPAETLNIRKTVTIDTDNNGGFIQGADITHVQLQTTAGGFLQTIYFETYADFISTRSPSDWTTVGSPFGLSLDETTVFNRLETSDYPIDHLWPQYNDGTTVKVANYKDKWTTPHDDGKSISQLVDSYLTLSTLDPRALETVQDDSSGDDPGFQISYVDILNVMALDYHVARMLGLGFIDTDISDDSGTSYVYMASYTNRQSIGVDTMTTYQYMSLPTSIADSRLPQTPVLKPISYQVPDNEALGLIFDENGYTIIDEVRLVNLTRALYNYELPDVPLANDPSSAADYNIFENSTSSLYGIEYRPITQTNYTKPEIVSDLTKDFAYYAYDTDFPEGVKETILTPDNAEDLYVHYETNSGVHAYAIYGVNWFSRASQLSNEEETDDTEFPLRNQMLAPADVAVQYVQEEDTPLFTTMVEQNWLAGRTDQFTGQNVDFTRVTFNRLDIIDLSYVKQENITDFDYSTVIHGTKVKAWFKPELPLQVTGVITDLQPLDNNQVAVYTGSSPQIDGTLAVPTIATDDLPRFTGSFFVTPDGQFTVVSVTEGADGPVFTLQQVAETNNIEDPADPGFYGTNTTYTSPSAGNRFTVTENLANADNWHPVTEDIQLVNFSDTASPLLETSTADDGHITRLLIGGLSDGAVIQQLQDNDHNDMPGYYSVTFDSAVLDPHPQVNLPYDPANPGANAPGSLHSPNVEWYNGLIRTPLADGSDKKVVQVVRIMQTNPIQLYVYDAGYQDDPIQTSTSGTDLVPLVNFHPGYRAWLFAEPAPSYFNGANILPTDQKGRKTLMSLQTADTDTGGSGLVSPLSPPVVLFARKIDVPVQPEMPLTYGLKVRPDATTKAAFTFDVKVMPDSSGAARSPFGFMFYRTSNEDVLEALYNPDTVTGILATLDGMTIDNNFNQRYSELVNLVFDTENPVLGSFKVYDGYGFPVPDKTGLLTSSDDTLDKIKSKCLDAIHSTLMPLTAQVPVTQYIKEGKQTDNKLPVIRTIDGDLLDPSSPSFDPFPMIRQYTNNGEANTTYVRFTDYMLNGSSRFLYFYGAAEVTNQLVIGPISPFAGPVTILHTIPAEAPLVKSFTLGPPAVVSDSPVAVTFYLTPFSPEDTITKIRIYRASDPNKALALVSMDSHVDVDVVMDSQLGIVATDTFDDLATIPFGDMIYYRLSFVRTISNEEDQPEDVVGLGSEVVTVNLIDTNNPDAPQLSYDQPTNTLSWSPTTNKGTYYLFQQNSKGNWQKIYSVTPTSATDSMTYTLPAVLPATDTDGNPLYYRFKVTVQNSSGLLNLADNELTI